MSVLIRAVSLSLSCGLVVAQAPNIQASVVSPLAVDAGWGPVSQGVGPIAPWGFNLYTSGLGTSASMLLSSASASAYSIIYQFTTSCSSTYMWPAPGAGTAQCAGVFELLLTRPSPTPVQVTIGAGPGGAVLSNAFCVTLVDINADGSHEASICHHNPVGLGNYNLVVGPGGTRIRVTHSSDALAQVAYQTAMANSSLQLTFTSGPASLDSYGVGCFELSGDVTQAGDLQLRCLADPGSLVILALGTTPLSMPLSFTPGCLLLLQPLVTTTTSPSAGLASFSFPGAAPPPGVSLLLQAGRLDPAGVFTTSNGLTLTGL